MTLLRSRGVIVRIATLTSLFVLVFVAYAHVASWNDARTMMTSPREIHFTSSQALANEITPNVSGDLKYEINGDALAIRGVTTENPSSLELRGNETKLIESSLKMRFRSVSNASANVVLGLDAASETRHTIRLVVARDRDKCFVRLIGDTHALGPSTLGDPVIAETPSTICDNQWHELALRFSPELTRIVVSVDDAILFSPNIWWDEMTTVRTIFGVSTTEPAQNVDVEISEVTWRPIALNNDSTDVDDTFRGKIIDPFWRVAYPKSDLVEGTLVTGPSGLVLAAHARTHSPNVVAFELAAMSAPLDSFTASVDVDVTTLTRATFHIGIRNEPGPAWRLAQVGFLSTDNVTMVPFESGHFADNGQSRFRAFPEAARPIGPATLTFDYDAKTGRGRATFDGTPFFDEHIDLPPRSLTHFGVGANVDDDGQAALVVRRVRVDHTRN